MPRLKEAVRICKISGAGSFVAQPFTTHRPIRNYHENEKYSHPFFLILILIVNVAACASTAKQEGTGDYIDDSVITTKIKSQLAADDFLQSFQISVESRKGIAQLSGFVDSQKALDRAGQIARGVDGVKSVRNDLIVK